MIENSRTATKWTLLNLNLLFTRPNYRGRQKKSIQRTAEDKPVTEISISFTRYILYWLKLQTELLHCDVSEPLAVLDDANLLRQCFHAHSA